jgi:hypothetical protein
MAHKIYCYFDNGDVRTCPVNAVRKNGIEITFDKAQVIAPTGTLERVYLLLDLGSGITTPPTVIPIKTGTRWKEGDCITIEPIRLKFPK